MLPATRKFSRFSKKEIEKLLFSARRICCYPGIIDIRIMPKSIDLARILIIIPRKAGNAPQRNLIRRRIKAIFYEEKLYSKQYDWVIFVKKNTQLYSFSELKELLLACSNNNKEYNF